MNSMKAFILQQEVPDLKTALTRAEASLQAPPSSGHGAGCCCTCLHLKEFLPDALSLDFCRIITTAASTTTTTTTSTSNKRAKPQKLLQQFRLMHPIHAMHLWSQLDWIPQQQQEPQEQQQQDLDDLLHNDHHYSRGGGAGGGGCIPVFMSEGATGSATTLLIGASPATTAALVAGQHPPLLYGDEQERMMAVQTPGLVEHWHPWLHELEKDPYKSDLDDDDESEEEDDAQDDDVVMMDTSSKNDNGEANDEDDSNRKRKREESTSPSPSNSNTTATSALMANSTSTTTTKSSSFSSPVPPAPVASLSSAASSSNNNKTSAAAAAVSKSAQGGTLAVAGRKLPISKTATSQRKLPFSSSSSSLSLSGSNQNKPASKSDAAKLSQAVVVVTDITESSSSTTTATTVAVASSASNVGASATTTTNSSSLSSSTDAANKATTPAEADDTIVVSTETDVANKAIPVEGDTNAAAPPTMAAAVQTSIVADSSSSTTTTTTTIAGTDKAESLSANNNNNNNNSSSSLPNNNDDDKDKELAPLDKPPTETTTITKSPSSMNVDDDKNMEEASGDTAAAIATAPQAASSSTLSATKDEEGTTTNITTAIVAKASEITTADATSTAPSSIPSTTKSSSTMSPAKTVTATTAKTLKSPPTKTKKNKYLLSDSQFRRYQSSEDSMNMLRRSLLSKRIATIPTSTTIAGVGGNTASSGAAGAAGNKKNSTQSSAKKKSTSAASTAKSGGSTTSKSKKGKDSGASVASSSTTGTTKTMHLKDVTRLIKPQPIPTIVVSDVKDVIKNNKKLGYDNDTTIIMTVKEQRQEEQAYITKMLTATRRVELWMNYYRFSQGAYYDRCRRRKQQQRQTAAAFALTLRQYQKPIHPMSSFFGAATSAVDSTGGGGVAQQQESFCCHTCHRSVTNIFQDEDDDDEIDHDDNLMQCLECNFVGCYHDGPTLTSSEMGDDAVPNGRHMQQHMALSNHCFAVTCGRAARIYCFKCGESDNNTINWVSHVVFEQEKERIQLAEKIPFMAWKEHPVQRSFDPLQFMRISPPDQGIVWKGMVATYPLIVPAKHLQAARRCHYRQILFEGGPIEDLLFFWNKMNANSIVQQQQQLVARDFLEFQQRRKSAARRGDEWWWKIRHPVGMFNLGSTCFQSAVFQCLVHCTPLQKYFLRDVGHHHAACSVYNADSVNSSIPLPTTDKSPKSSKSSGVDASLAARLEAKKNKHSCLASELDKLILDYYGSSIGININAALCACDNNDDSTMESPGPRKKTPATVIGNMLGITNNTSKTLPTAVSSAVAAVQQGDPLITADILAETWKCTEMAGYAQKDAHEFLHAFLDIVGKHSQRYREQVYQCIHSVDILATSKSTEMPSASSTDNIIAKLFEGTLRSVLLCQECGNKRTQSEQFLSISLPLSKEVQKATVGKPGESMGHIGNTKISVERCLRHFTLPEMLADSVDCPSCGKKTPTKKQHVVSKLPRVLCLHLKRFDALQNKKIEDHVSFPVHNFNMGSFLPHWCEVTSVPTTNGGQGGQPEIGLEQQQHQAPPPQLLYNLFGTVNHSGNLQSGHYVANVKVDGSWYLCNDAHVSQTTEADVIKSDAYLLFYIRQ